ncbi:hypothetical protein C8A05DRAFT_32337 [Staphylotrichum tortipilum]|uniref:Uncharacterized protein n=1 Tax=Staphylotrichum tortipilum TaxID=2831512 RepID=A0AAN6RUX5_9PEZI|nr:hypothetical protein C8A05DRAFT_32337 [Staphylotrichum longicolle]
MGIFSFLSRKSGTKAKAATLTKPPPLVSTNPAPLPSRDEYPAVTRHAVAPVDTPHRGAASVQRRPSLSSDDDDDDDDDAASSSSDESPAPGPAIPRCRDASPERPSTAPSSAAAARPSSLILLSGRPRLNPRPVPGGQSRPPPLSFRMVRPGTAITSSRLTSMGSVSSAAAASLPGRGRASSLRGDGTKAFKDILDAQSEIKPADFRARVQAAGARDYGEDVAERNMGENGFNLGAPHVRAFYYERYATGGQRGSVGSMLEPTTGPRAGRAGVRRLGFRSSQPALVRQGRGGYLSGGEMSSPEPMGRRRSEVAFLSSMSMGAGNREFLSRASITSLGSLGSRGSSSMRSRGIGSGAEHLGFTAQGLTAPGVLHPLETAPAPTVRTARRARGQSARGVGEAAPAEDAVGDDWAGDFALWSATRLRRSATILSSASGPRKNSLHGVRSSISSVASRETLDHVTPLAYPPKTAGHGSGRESALSHTRGFPLATPPATATPDMALADDEPLEYPPPIRTRSMRGWSASSSTPTAAESIATTSITTSSFHHAPSLRTADTSVVDLDAGAPSLRLKPSLCFSRNDSITPASDFSDSDGERDAHDDDIPRPHLHPIPPRKTHTHSTIRPQTATSAAVNFPPLPDLYPLDATTTTSSASSASSASSIHPPNPDSESDDGSDDETTAREPDGPAPGGDNFNIDDYLSSDAASLTAPANRRPTADGEEELLFDDGGGFGVGGMELPGLNEAFSLTGLSGVGVDGKERKKGEGKSVGFEGDFEFDEEEGEVDEVEATPRRRMRGKRSSGWERTRHYVLNTAADSDSSRSPSPSSRESDSDSDWDRDFGRRRRTHNTNTKHHHHPRRRRDSHHSAHRQPPIHPRRRSSLLPIDPPFPTALPNPPTSPVLSRQQRQQRHQRRLSALQRLEGGIIPHHLATKPHSSQHHNQSYSHTLLSDETATSAAPDDNDDDKVAAAVRLRKEVMRARRLAGKPSAAGLRRKESAKLAAAGSAGRGVAVWER